MSDKKDIETSAKKVKCPMSVEMTFKGYAAKLDNSAQDRALIGAIGVLNSVYAFNKEKKIIPGTVEQEQANVAVMVFIYAHMHDMTIREVYRKFGVPLLD